MAKSKKKTAPAKPELGEIAATGGGRDITAKYVGELDRSRDSVLSLKGGNLSLYEKVLNDDQVQSTFQQRRLAVVSSEWAVSPGGDDPIDEEAADFLREQLETVSWNQKTNKMLYGLFYGYAVAEMMWGVDGNRVVIDDIKVRKQRRFGFDKDRQLRLLTRDNPRGEIMQDRKFWVFSTGADNDDEPYGLGLGHWLYWPTFFKRNDLKFWLMFLDKFGMPTGKGTYPAGTTESDQKKLLEAVAAIHTDSGVIIPEGMLIELIEATRTGGVDYGDLYDRMDAAISKVVLSQTMTTDDGSSLSQSQTHEGVKDDVIASDAEILNESFRCGPATWLTEWNFPGAKVPVLSRLIGDEEDLSKTADKDLKLRKLGFEPTDEYISETYGDNYVRVTPSKPETPEDDPEDKKPDDDPDADSFAENLKTPPATDPDIVDAIALQALADEGWVKPMEAVTAPLHALAESSADLEEFRDHLTDVIDEMDTAALQELLARSSFGVRVAAAVGADAGDETPTDTGTDGDA